MRWQKGGQVLIAYFRKAVIWRPVNDFNIDLIYGRNIAGENSNWLTLATVVRFPAGK